MPFWELCQQDTMEGDLSFGHHILLLQLHMRSLRFSTMRDHSSLCTFLCKSLFSASTSARVTSLSFTQVKLALIKQWVWCLESDGWQRCLCHLRFHLCLPVIWALFTHSLSTQFWTLSPSSTCSPWKRLEERVRKSWNSFTGQRSGRRELEKNKLKCKLKIECLIN